MTNNSPANTKGSAVDISHNTIHLCLELLNGVSVPVTLPDAEDKMKRLVTARQELLAVLPDKE